jgi:hypothetical protein
LGFGRGTYGVLPSFALGDEDPASAARARPAHAPLPRTANEAATPRRTPRRDTRSPCGPFPLSRCDRFIVLLVLSATAAALPLDASARHLARLDPTEPIFTQRSFVEGDLELDVGWEHESSSDTIEFAPGGSWVAVDRLELDLEIPAAVVIPENGPTVGSLGDVGFAAQLQVCCAPDRLLDYFSLRAEVEAPTGSRGKEIDGTGSWGVSLLPGRLFTIAERLPDLLVQLELAYAQEIRVDAAGEEAARHLGVPRRVEKDVDWNLAFAQQYWDGRIRPVVELLGTTIVDATDPGDEGTIVELAAGGWVAPFFDEHWLSPVSIGLGFGFPLTSRKESDVTGRLVVEWSFGS